MEPAHDPKRFEEVVLFISEQTADDPEFGSTKLAKVLYHSDIESYRSLGEAITGAEYQAWERGPYPPKLEAARRLLSNAGRVTLEQGAEYEPDRIIPTAERPSDLNGVGVTPEQAAIIRRWIKNVQKLSSNEVSRRSHKDPGWRAANRDAVISYDDGGFLADRPPSPEDVQAATQIARERGWLVGNRWKRR